MKLKGVIRSKIYLKGVELDWSLWRANHKIGKDEIQNTWKLVRQHFIAIPLIRELMLIKSRVFVYQIGECYKYNQFIRNEIKEYNPFPVTPIYDIKS